MGIGLAAVARRLALLVLAVGWGACGQLRAAPPNLVFLFVDTLRADHCSCYGYRRPTTPSLDSVAARGTLFEKAFAQANMSLPSYTTVFTSLYPEAHGVTGPQKTLGPGPGTLAEILAIHGYDTAGFVADGHLSPSYGLGRGFATYQSTGYAAGFMRTVPAAIDWLDRRRPGAARPQTAGPVASAPRSAQASASASGPGPFFLLVHGYDAHGPYSPPLGFGELYDPGYEGIVHWPGFLRTTFLEQIRNHTYDPTPLVRFQSDLFQQVGWPWKRQHLLPSFQEGMPAAPEVDRSLSLTRSPYTFLSKPTRSGLPTRLPAARASLTTTDELHLVAHYDGSVTYADMWVGLFMEALERRGLTSSTYVFVAGDHGESLGEHGLFGHGFALNECTLHVPLVVAGPGVPAGRRVSDVVELIDLAPTTLALAAIPASRQHQGRSLAQYLRPGPGPAGDPGRVAYASMGDAFSARGPRWHLMSWPGEGPLVPGKRLLYDTQTDPTEQTDLAADRPGELQTLHGKLMDWLEQTALTGPAAPSQLEPAERSKLRMFGYW
ncbi:MAG: sulfatase-like hydrolase/transferase [Candidatus Riflebacteria bacterium]|nr:sulfatase-like hydrolase/transferase [Candidatus Riflebacteria bacterium]